MKHASRSRQSVNLSESMLRKIEMYGLAAAAAGLGIAALSSSGQAEVVFTPAHQEIPSDGGLTLDLNHDGISDFRLVRAIFGFADSAGLLASSLHGNRVMSTGGSRGRVSNLPAGYSVGPNSKKFGAGSIFSSKFGPAKLLYNCVDNSGINSCHGPWDKDTSAGYVGFRFSIQGQTHYGWARLRVVTKQPNDQFSVYLTGYAYETIPNKPIMTGKTSGAVAKEADTPGSLRPASAGLGMLSAGASGLPMWRAEIQ